MIDNVKQGISLASQAMNLMRGGFNPSKIHDAQLLIGGAKTFFAGLSHHDDGPVNQHGLGEEHFVEDWKNEGKDVWMFSGCADNQTSADTSIQGASTGKYLGDFPSNPADMSRRYVVWISQDHETESKPELYPSSSEHPSMDETKLPTDSSNVCWWTL
jgi:hypothetical protein